MSDVVMCDSCGYIFPKDEDGSQTFMHQTRERVPSSSLPVVVSERRMDLCKNCAPGGMVKPPVPKVRLELD